jgi:hypothetical protein
MWGDSIEIRKYLFESLQDIVEILDRNDSTWYSIGNLSKKGHPQHPLSLYLTSDKIQEFCISEYINKFKK